VEKVYRYTPTFNIISVISWWSVLLVEETGVPRENHRPAVKSLTNLSHNVVSSTPHHERGSFKLTTLFVIGMDCTCSCKSNYHTMTTMMAPSDIDNDNVNWHENITL
jgi:hypothetical protein